MKRDYSVAIPAIMSIIILVSCGASGSSNDPSGTTAQFRFKHPMLDMNYCQHIEGKIDVKGATLYSRNNEWSGVTLLSDCGTVRVYSYWAYEGAPLPCGWSAGYSDSKIACGKHNLFDWWGGKYFNVTTGAIQ